MKIQRIPASLLVSACCLATSAWAEAPQMKPGKWSITMKSDAEGDATDDDSSMNMTQCMTQEDLNSQVMSSAAPAAGEKDGDFEMATDEKGCKFSMNRKGTVMKIDSDCEGEKSVTVITYSTESFRVESTITNQDGKSVNVMEGKRVGDCSAG